jgi:glycosyltransferase involved in cell wall biosynthesis
MRNLVVFIAGKDPLEKPGGHSSYVRAHARAAIHAGFEPHIFCAGPRTEVVHTEFGTLHRVASPFRPFRQILVAGHAPLLGRGVERFLLARGPGPHLIHSFGLWGCVGVAVSRSLGRRGVAAVTVTSSYTTYEHEAQGKVRGLSGDRPRLQLLSHRAQLPWVRAAVRPYERRAYTQSDVVTVNYESVRTILARQYGESVRPRVMRYASEAAFRVSDDAAPAAGPDLPVPGRPDSPLIVAVSRHDPRKGVDVLLRALGRLQAMGVRFRACLVGGGMLLGEHRRLAASLRLDGTVALTGWVPDSYPYLERASVFVLPSLQEGSGSLSLLEAMQAGVAIVASNLDGIPEDVADGVSALLVPPGDADALAAALRRVLEDAALRQRLAAAARAEFAARFTAAAFSADLRNLYAELGFDGAPAKQTAAATNRGG